MAGTSKAPKGDKPGKNPKDKFGQTTEQQHWIKAQQGKIYSRTVFCPDPKCAQMFTAQSSKSESQAELLAQNSLDRHLRTYPLHKES